MSNKLILASIILVLIAGVVTISACKKDVGPTPAPKNPSFVEEFDTLQDAIDKGWTIINNSRAIGSASWLQGDYGIDQLKGVVTGFPPQSSSYSGQDFVVCTYNCGDGDATLSAWLISPPTLMKTGDQLVFYTRTTENPAQYPDRMQVRVNTTDSGTNVGAGPLRDTSVASMTGHFTDLLLDINPNLAKAGPGSYPGSWTKFTATIKNIPQPAERRFAFRYYVTNGGTTGNNSQGVGVDSVAFISK